MKRAVFALTFVAALMLPGCAFFQNPTNVSRIKVLENIGCIVAKLAWPDARSVTVACGLAPELTDDVAIVMGETRAAADRETEAAVAAERAKAGCRPAPTSLVIPQLSKRRGLSWELCMLNPRYSNFEGITQ